MTRNLKALGLALIAVFAMGAIVASSASATSFHFNSNAADGHTILNGEQIGVHKFNTTAGEVTCEVAKFTGTTTSNTVTDVTIKPTYEKCHIVIFGSKVSATVNMNGCEYTATSHQTVAGVTTAATIHLVNCTKEAEVVAAGCTVKIATGQTLGGQTFSNGAGDVKLVTNTEGIKYSHSGFTCGTGSGSNGTYKGETTIKGTNTVGGSLTVSYDVAP
ncbi:MAG TPA: hypothetical protein VFU11_04425 [Solirubrobacterales bacterium]|nr:hypothetical protein [Solirubrobacterales bacterium]